MKSSSNDRLRLLNSSGILIFLVGLFRSTFEKKIHMKKILSGGVLFSAAFFMISCGNNTAVTGSDSLKNDSAAAQFVLEDLLQFETQADLEKKFGKEHVKFDTIWGPEGNWVLGTYIDKGTRDEVQLIWGDDSLSSGGVVAASTEMNYEGDDHPSFNSKWVSETGVKLGMTTGELEKLNGRAFTFSGFGWDYGGAVMDWKGGKLDTQGLGVELTEGSTEISEAETEEILGDKDVRSDNAVVKKVQPKVAKVTVFRKGD